MFFFWICEAKYNASYQAWKKYLKLKTKQCVSANQRVPDEGFVFCAGNTIRPGRDLTKEKYDLNAIALLQLICTDKSFR